MNRGVARNLLGDKQGSLGSLKDSEVQGQSVGGDLGSSSPEAGNKCKMYM